MIKRIVKLSINIDKVGDFISVFNENKDKILCFDGCEHVELWQDIEKPNIIFTYSLWKNVQSLNKYRDSDLFRSVWTNVKPFFHQKAVAWSLK